MQLNGDLNEDFDPLRVSIYHQRLQVWLNLFPRDQILVVNGDRLARNPAAELERVERFLGVQRYLTDDKFVFVQSKGPKGFFCLKGNYRNAQALCLGGNKGREHPKVSDELLREMRDYFQPHNERFYELIGNDFGWS